MIDAAADWSTSMWNTSEILPGETQVNGYSTPNTRLDTIILTDPSRSFRQWPIEISDVKECYNICDRFSSSLTATVLGDTQIIGLQMFSLINNNSGYKFAN